MRHTRALAVFLIVIAAAASPGVSLADASCSIGSPASGGVVAVTGEFEPRITPSARGQRIKNDKASSILGKIVYHEIDSSTTVKQLCADGDWSKIQVVTPTWLTHVIGWVPTKVLRGIERTAGGARVYVAADFSWDRDTAKHKNEIVTIINKIAREHSMCADIDTASIARSKDRSKPGQPVFFVTCNPRAGAPFNVWFRPSDVARTFSASTPIAKGAAINACEQAAKQKSRHPSTVDFSRIMSVAYSARGDGRATLWSQFTAKNDFNLELTYKIRCLFQGAALIEANVVEAR